MVIKSRRMVGAGNIERIEYLRNTFKNWLEILTQRDLLECLGVNGRTV
jgi:hypothetical protein